MKLASVPLLAAIGLLFAAPAQAWESQFVVQNAERFCQISSSIGITVTLAETSDKQRQTRITYLPGVAGVPRDAEYFLALADGKGVRTKSGVVEGSAAVKFVYGMLSSSRVRVGYSSGVGPPLEKDSISLHGFEQEFQACIHDLDWQHDTQASSSNSSDAEAEAHGPPSAEAVPTPAVPEVGSSSDEPARDERVPEQSGRQSVEVTAVPQTPHASASEI